MPDEETTLSASVSRAVAAFGPYELYMLVLSMFSISVLAADTMLALHPSAHQVLEYTDTVLCVLFFADFLRNLRRAEDKNRYFLRGGWLDLVSSVPAVGVLRLGRLVRIARLVRLMRAMRSVRTIGQVILRKRAQGAMLAATTVSILLVVFGSLAVLQFEQRPDSNIKTGGDALWWAFATITTVGYGDRYPVTLEGRVVAAMLMTAGVGLFGAMSGLVASWFLHADQQQETDQVSKLTTEVARLSTLIEQRNDSGR